MEIRHVATADIAVVSDDARIVDTITAALTDDETIVTPRQWGSAGADSPTAWERPDVVILDDATAAASTAPRIGYLRRRWPTLLVAVVNAPCDTRAAELLDAGADEAVLAGSPACVPRLRAIARRARMVNASTRIAVGDVVFEREARRVWCAGREIELSPREFAVLDCLFWKAPATVSTEALADYVWGDAEASTRRGVAEVYIGYLRKKLAASRQVVIGTVRGQGYRFEPRG